MPGTALIPMKMPHSLREPYSLGMGWNRGSKFTLHPLNVEAESAFRVGSFSFFEDFGSQLLSHTTRTIVGD